MPRRPNIIHEVESMTTEEVASLGSECTTAANMKDESISSGNGSMIDEEEPMMTIKNEPGLEDYTASGGIALNLANKSGRKRKQSKPIRVFIDLDNEGAGDSEANRVPVEAGGKSAPEEGGVNHHPSSVSEGVEDKDEGMGMDIDDILTCDLCNNTYSSQALLDEHIQSVHNLNNNEPKHMDMFPTKYHQLGSQLQQQAAMTVIKPEGREQDNDKEFGSSNPEHMRMDSPGNASGDCSGSKSMRIFHPDAYCEICDREFCNKYFLKTHKANKHGIYDNSLPNGNDQNGGLAGYPTFIPPPDLAMANFSMQERHSSPPAASQPPPPLPSQPQDTSTPTVLSQMPVMSKTPSKPAEETPTKSPIDMEDYCEICQKHFCNKYYLKKHKQDVHGIVPDTPPVKRNRTPSLPISEALTSSSPALNGFSNSISTTASMPFGIPQIPMTSAAGVNSAANVTTMANLMFINPFAPPIAIVHAQQVPLQAGPTGFAPQGISPLPQVPPQITGAEAAGSGTPKPSPVPSSSSSPTNSMPNDALRGIGVLNADAYCELCRKEFCNKYFLRIHKANKHGIFTDEPLQPGLHPSAGPMFLPGMPVAGMDGMPIPQAFIGPDGSLLLPHPQLLELHKQQQKQQLEQQRLQQEKAEKAHKTEPEEYSCKVCNKDFASKYSMKIHMINVHDVKVPDIKSEPGDAMEMGKDAMSRPGVIVDALRPSQTVSPASSEGSNMSTTIFGNMIAAKLADRVMCEICNKEVCNKYFLKTHKMKVHGIDLKDIEKEHRTDSPNKLKMLMPTDLSKKIPEPPPQDIQRPRDDELLKMGIDPEAYCEICKKEFCSKYFLKTHKLNIHGIKTVSTLTPEKPIPPPTAPVVSQPPPAQLLPRLIRPPAPVLPSAPVRPPPPPPRPNPSPPTVINTMAPLMSTPNFMNPMHMADLSDMSERRSWKWKEPINSTRVMCDICNKELCNKYFLRTHLVNKHGLVLDANKNTITQEGYSPDQNWSSGNSSQEPTAPESGKSKPTMEPMNIDTSSTDSDSVQKAKVNSISPSSKALPKEEEKGGESGAINLSTTVSAKTWHVPSEYKQDTKDDKRQGDLSNGTSEAKTSSYTDGDPFIKKCTICGMLFGETVTLRLHMIQDHPGHGLPNSEGSMHLADPKVSLASTIGLTLKRKYQRNVKRKIRPGRRWRKLGQNGGAIGEKVKSAIMNHIQNHQRKKKFRCAHCQERFLSRTLCQAHIRCEHPNAKPLENTEGAESSEKRVAKQNSPVWQDKAVRSKPQSQGEMTNDQGKENASGNAGSGDSNIPIAYATPCDTPKGAEFVMQAFMIQQSSDEQSNFATSMVYLPVLQKISEPTTVSFKLTPTTT